MVPKWLYCKASNAIMLIMEIIKKDSHTMRILFNSQGEISMIFLSKTAKKAMSSVLMAGIIALSIPGAGFGASDLNGHWASTQMNAWIGQGIIKGYPDGTVKPDASVTRAEFMAMVNKAYRLSGSSGKAFKDVSAKSWYSSVIDTAATAGYIGGYPDGTMRPDARISRNEAAVIIMKASGLSGNSTASSVFSDSRKIPSWAQAAVGAAYRKGAMSGYPDGTFGGERYISRAEAVISLSRSVTAPVTPPAPITPVSPVITDRTYSDPGSYGSDSTQTIKGNATIKVSGVTLNNLVIEGDLIIAKEVSNGDATLKNVTVKGNTYIYGGGPNSVRFTNVSAGKVNVSRESGTVRLVLSGTTVIDKVIAKSDLKLEESSLSRSGAGYLSIESGYTSGVDVELIGTSLDEVDMSASGSTLSADSRTTVTRFTVSARDTVVTLESGSTVSRLIADAAVKVRGKGTVTRADVNVSNVTFETTPKETNTKSGVTPPSTSNPYIVSFNPSDGSTGASIGTDIVITFSETVRKTTDTELTSSNVDNLITLRSGSSNGTNISFDATVRTSSGRTVITVDPTGTLSQGTRYYVSVEELEDFDNLRVTGSQSATFTTAGNTAPRIESFSPASGARNVAIGSNIVITFSETVRKTYGNTTLTDSNVASLIRLKKNSRSGTDIAFNTRVTVSGGKTVITIDPVNDLPYGQPYYVSVSDLEDTDDLVLTGTTYGTFTTISNPAPTVENFVPSPSATGVRTDSNLSLRMSEVVRLLDNTTLSGSNVKPLVVLKKGSASGETVLFETTVETVSEKSVITVNPATDLLPNQQYYWALSGLEDVTDQILTGTLSASFTTAPLADPVPTIKSISPASDAPLGTNIVITFSEVMRALNAGKLENNTVDGLITLKITNSSGANVNFDATVDSSSGYTIITIDPSDNLAYNTDYYVAVTGVEDTAGQTVSGNAIFRTMKATASPLTGLTVEGTNGAVSLSPAFTGGTYAYTATVANDCTSVRITPGVEGGSTAVVALGSEVKVDGNCLLAEGSNTITVTVEKTDCANLVYSLTLTREKPTAPADTTAPAFVSAAVGNGNQTITLTFDENLVNNTADTDALKSAISFSADGNTFRPLESGDTVSINGSSVTISFSTAITGLTNAVTIAANTLKDGAANLCGAVNANGIAAK